MFRNFSSPQTKVLFKCIFPKQYNIENDFLLCCRELKTMAGRPRKTSADEVELMQSNRGRKLRGEDYIMSRLSQMTSKRANQFQRKHSVHFTYIFNLDYTKNDKRLIHYVLRVLKTSLWDPRCQTYVFKTRMT